jgi:hypothetical protein
MHAIVPTPLLLEHRRLLSSLAAMEAQPHGDDAVDALCDELSDVERRILGTPIRSRADVLARISERVLNTRNNALGESLAGDHYRPAHSVRSS